MTSIHSAGILTLAMFCVLAGCSRVDAPLAPAASRSAAATGSTVAAPGAVQACALVTQAEMTAILGGPVIASSNDGEFNGQTHCIYSPAAQIGPYAELKLEWGMGEAAMTASGMMARIEPGLTNSYEGLGDQASAVGPAIMIRKGEDLITIIALVDDDPEAKVRQIYATAAARM